MTKISFEEYQEKMKDIAIQLMVAKDALSKRNLFNKRAWDLAKAADKVYKSFHKG